jgi:hypothetical protein
MSPWGTGYMVSPSCTRKEQERRSRQEHPAPRRTRGLGTLLMLNRTGPCSRSSSVHSVISNAQSFTSVVVVYLCTYVHCRIMFEHSPRFFVSLHLEHPSSILCFMSCPYAGMQCRCGYDFGEAMFHTAWYMYSQTPFSIFEPFYGGIVNSKQSNLGKVHENAVPCSLVNAMIIRSQRVM